MVDDPKKQPEDNSDIEETVRQTIERSIREVEGKAAASMKELNPDVQKMADHAVLGVCELLGLLFALPFGDRLYHGEQIADRHWAYLIVGLLFAGAGAMFPWIRTREWVSHVFSASLSRAALDARIWIAALLISFIYVMGPDLYRRATSPTDQPNLADKASALASSSPTTGNINPAVRQPAIVEKNFVAVTPQELMGFYKQNMTSEGDRLLAPYLGKWLSLTQEVYDTRQNQVWSYVMVDDGPMRAVVMNFDPPLSAQVEVLRKGQKIKASCQIGGATINIVIVGHCEFERQ